MPRGFRAPALLAAALLLVSPATAALRITGSSTINPVVAEAAEALRARGMEILVDTAGGSSGGLAALGEGRVEVAMSSRPVSDADRRKFPDTAFEPVVIGLDGVALVVSPDVWEGGVRDLSREEMQGIYEGRIRRWSQIGGPDRRIAFFNKEPGRGTWSVFARWLYGDPGKAPLVSFPEVGSSEETRSKVAGTPGALAQLSAAWAEGDERLRALGIRLPSGEVVQPDAGSILSGRYPLSRRLLLVTDGPLAGEAERLVRYVLGREGQALVARHGYLPVAGETTRQAP